MLESTSKFSSGGSSKRMAKTPKNICITYRPQSPRALETATEVVQWLTHKKLHVFTHPDLSPIPGTKKITGRGQIAALDLVLVLGGDGTFLSAVRMLQDKQTPILGVNLGHLGFLTETKVEELYDVLNLALKNKMQRVERTTLRAQIVKKNGKKFSYHALNDVVVERGPNSRLIDLSIYSGTFLVSTVKADGLILATPTGSTAYCLAAGGPIVHPSVSAINMTPICPHTLTNRPIILPDNQAIKLKLKQHPGKAVLMVDGQRCEDLTSSDELIITRGKHPVVMLTLPTRNYFDILRAKLRFGQRE
jgi:NAD+ kinase